MGPFSIQHLDFKVKRNSFKTWIYHDVFGTVSVYRHRIRITVSR